MKKLKNILLILCLTLVGLSSINSCGNLKQIPIKDTTDIATRDSIVIKDSTRLIDSIVYVEIPREKIMDIIKQIDTSRIETSVAKSVAYVDTNSLMIIHSLENKDTVLQTRVVYQDRFIEKEKIVYRDTTITKDVPVEVIVEKTKYPKTYWWLLGFFVIVIGIAAVRIYLKFKTGK